MHDVNIPKIYFDQVRLGMRDAVADQAGTAHALWVKDLTILGKTGTAQSSEGKANHAWFVGFCPEAKTPIVFCVFLENGGSSHNACVKAASLLNEMKLQDIL
jgi:penicillin-binding protein 2